jgi:hypothetical protein
LNGLYKEVLLKKRCYNILNKSNKQSNKNNLVATFFASKGREREQEEEQHLKITNFKLNKAVLLEQNTFFYSKRENIVLFGFIKIHRNH